MKFKLNRLTIAGIMVAIGLLVGGLALGIRLIGFDLDNDAGRETSPDLDELLAPGKVKAQEAAPTPASAPIKTNEANEANEANEINEANEANETNEANEVNEADEANEANEVNEANEANESVGQQGEVKITPDQAQAAVLAANPGATALEVKLEKGNGAQLVYEVKLNNGVVVYVDPNSGQILKSGSDNDDDND